MSYLQGFYPLIPDMRSCGTCFLKIKHFQQFSTFGDDNYLPKNLAVCKFAPYFWGKQKRLGEDKLIQELFQKIEVLTSRLEQAENEIAALKLENAALKSRLNSNSHNSSKPPSSDGYLKKPAFPKTGKGKQGGQPGHQGRTLNQVNNPDKTVTCNPVSCSCGHTFTSGEMSLAEKRQVFDLPEPRLEVTEYRIHKAVCPVCGLVHRGAAPEVLPTALESLPHRFAGWYTGALPPKG